MTSTAVDRAERLKAKIRSVPDFPKPGIDFKDITPLLQDREAFAEAVDLMAEPFREGRIDKVAAVDARGFILGGPIARELSAGLVLIRKAGKLPYETYSETFDLEYGSATVEVHQDAFEPGERVLLCDDLLATGGTMAASLNLLERFEVEVAGITFLIELTFLNGREKLGEVPVHSIIQY